MTDLINCIKENLRKGIIVYSFVEKGECLNCGGELYKNKFGNWICAYCHIQAVYNKRGYLERLHKKWRV